MILVKRVLHTPSIILNKANKSCIVFFFCYKLYMEVEKAQKISDIREHYKTDIEQIKNILHNAEILKNEKLRDILFAKEIENFNKIKNENKQDQGLNDYIVNDIIDRLVDEIYEQITTNNYSFDDFKLKIFLDKSMFAFFRLHFNIKNIEQESQIISMSHSSHFKEYSVILPSRKPLLNIAPSERISLTKSITDKSFSMQARNNEYVFQFEEYLGENNKKKQPQLMLKKNYNEYNIILNDNNTITISKEKSEENDQQKLTYEIQSTFFKEDETKTLFENLEYELTDEQMKFYNKIKELLGCKKISVEQPEVKYEPKVKYEISVEQPKVRYSLCGKENNWIGTKSNGSFGCCGW